MTDREGPNADATRAGRASAVGTRRHIRLVLADHQALMRAGFRMALGAEPDFDIIGEAGDGAEAVELVRRLQPDVLLMDVQLPRRDGIAATRAIVTARLPVRVLLLAGSDHDAYAAEGLRAGASGLLAKGVSAGDLSSAIRTVATGEAVVIPPLILRRLLDRFPGAMPEPDTTPGTTPLRELDSLTEREREVLLQVARGLSNAEIAAKLLVSETTVKTHVGRVLTKLGLRDRVQAVVLAYEIGLVKPGS